jgi:prepilin-type N-terminal cleavage/methylation domain-containing protein
MKIFLSGRYSRRDRLRSLRQELERSGHTVTSRWLDTSWSEADASGSSAAPAEYRAEFAIKDLEDVAAADCLVAFTEPPRSNGRGGRHVEYGAALALGKRVMVVGHRENLFYHHPAVEFFQTEQDLLRRLGAPHAIERPAFTLTEMLCCLAILAVLIGLLLPAVQKARESAARLRCANHLKSLSLGWHGHELCHGTFPCGGKGWWSPPAAGVVGAAQGAGWGYQVLPWVEQEAAWRSGPAAVGQTVPLFFCPSRRGPTVIQYRGAQHALCDYSASCVEGTGVIRQSPAPGVRLAEVADGTSNTLMLSEKRLALSELGSNGVSNDGDGYCAGWDEDTLLSSLYTPERDTSLLADRPTPPWRPYAGSSHPSGLNVATADGSVRVVGYGVSPAAWRALCTRDGGEAP